MSYRLFVEQVQSRSGSSDALRVERAIAATLELLGQHLRTPDARAVAQKLPPELACHLRGSDEVMEDGIDLRLTELTRICSDEGVASGELRAVCRVLAETLDEQGRAQLRLLPLGTRLFG